MALAKARPQLGGLAGIGTPGHLSLALFNLAGTHIEHVVYKGNGPALIDPMAGTIHIVFATSSTAVALMKAGKLKGIAVSTAKRSALGYRPLGQRHPQGRNQSEPARTAV